MKHMSYAVRLQLTKSVLISICTYWMQMFLLPKQTIYEIKKKIHHFLWAGSSTNHGSHKVAWRVVFSSKQEGGLGLPDLNLWNKVLLGHTMWNLINHPSSSLWSSWVHSTKCRGTPFLQMDMKGSMAWTWRCLLKLRHVLAPVMSNPRYCCHDVLDELRHESPAVEWYNLIWSSGISKHNFFVG